MGGCRAVAAAAGSVHGPPPPRSTTMRSWTWLVPLAAVVLFGLAHVLPVSPAFATACGAALVGAVLAAVHHAEVVAHRVGEPAGTLVLALAVTAIEAALLLSMVIAGGEQLKVLTRDAIYATVMITLNGVVGLCVTLGGILHREQSFRVEGAGSGLAALVVMATLTLVLPEFTTTTGVGTYSPAQLLFVAASSAALWGIFVFVQTVRHRDYFLPETDADDPDVHATPPGARQAAASAGMLMVALVGVVGLAETLSHPLEQAVDALELPRGVVGILVAVLVLLPETFAAVRAARANRLQSSINLAVGSALASIGLTVPIVVLASLALGLPLVLGLGAKDMTLLATTLLVSAITLGTGRTTVMQGAVHLVLFAAFVFLACVP